MEKTCKKDYVITTRNGCIPYVVNTTEAHFVKPRKVLIDDFLYKDSFYDKNNTLNINEYIACDTPVLIGYKHLPRVLVSKRGHYKLNETRYEQVMKQMGSIDFFDFKTGKLFYDKNEVYEPKDIDDFNKCKHTLVGTNFINNLTDKGMVIYDNHGILSYKHITETDLEYQKYMYSINEIIAFTYISENNYKVMYNFITMRNDKKE